MAWVEVGKKDCEYCGGTGVERAWIEQIQYRGITECRKKFPCRDCGATGQESVGYQS